MSARKLDALLADLPEPNHRTDSFALFQGDATRTLKRIPKDSVPLVLTSPPYNIGMSYETVQSPSDYADWLESWLTELARITTPNGSVWLNLGYMAIPGRGTAVPIPYLIWNQLAPLHLVQEVVWYFRAGVACRRRLSPRNEKLLWLVKNPDDYAFDLDSIRQKDTKYPDQKRAGRSRCNPLGRNPSDVWEIPRVTGGRNRSSPERTSHPAQMPLEIAIRVISACSRPGDLVLDPFCGSGTTIEAAMKLKRTAIGIDLDNNYLKIANERLKRLG